MTAPPPIAAALDVLPELGLGQGDLVVHQRGHLGRRRGDQLAEAAVGADRAAVGCAHRDLPLSCVSVRRAVVRSRQIMPDGRRRRRTSPAARRRRGHFGKPAVLGGLRLVDRGHPQVVLRVVLFVDVGDAVVVLVALLVLAQRRGTCVLRSFSRTPARTAAISEPIRTAALTSSVSVGVAGEGELADEQRDGEADAGEGGDRERRRPRPGRR